MLVVTLSSLLASSSRFEKGLLSTYPLESSSDNLRYLVSQKRLTISEEEPSTWPRISFRARPLWLPSTRQTPQNCFVNSPSRIRGVARFSKANPSRSFSPARQGFSVHT